MSDSRANEPEQSFATELSDKQQLDLLFSYTAKIAAEQEVDKLLVLMADLGRQLVVADRCSIWLKDKQKKELWTKVAHGVPELRIPAGTGVVGQSIQSGEIINIKDAYKDPRHNHDVDGKTGYHTRSILVVPFKNAKGKIMGAFQAINKRTEVGVFSEADIERLNLTAAYSGKSLESAQLYKQTVDLLKEIEETQREVILRLGEVGESRSKETGFHVKRVAEYSYLLAKKFGLSYAEAMEIKIASPMHDIGKVAIPDAILKKPGRLTEEEFLTMKKHAEIGRQVLEKSNRSLLKAAATIAGSHHEKYNGTGYPEGLKGEAIPLMGRIVAIADVFDALANERCYKPAWPREKIELLFREERGEHFDPRLTDLLLENLDEFYKINEMYSDLSPDASKVLVIGDPI